VTVFVNTNVWLAGWFGRCLCADFLDALVTLYADTNLKRSTHHAKFIELTLKLQR